MAVSLPRQNYDLMNRESNGRAAVFDYDAIVTSAKGDTLKRSLDKDELSNEALGMNCKDKNESDNEPDGEPAAKMRRGGGRRKQSKPMRMFADLETDMDPSRPVSDSSAVESDYGKGAGTSAAATDGPTAPSTNTVVCELCQENFQTGGALKEHIDQVHTMVLGEEPVQDNACLTKYHLLGKELIQDTGDFESSGKLDAKEMGCTVSDKQIRLGTPAPIDDNNMGTKCDWASMSKDEELVISSAESAKQSDRESHHAVGKAPASDQLQVKFLSGCDESKLATSTSFGSMMDKPLEGCIGKQDFGASAPVYEAGVQSETHSSQAATSTYWDANKSRIFHPDAYCEICDREFCNKYFLKTHKANKHGIYDNNMSGLEAAASTSSNNELFFSMLQTQQPPSTTPPKSSPPKQERELGGCSSANLLLSGGVSNMAEDSGSVTPGKSSGSSDSDECCDICQKHFLSKSQLKRHKQEAHGFPQSSSDGIGKRSSIANVSSPSSMLLNASMENPVSSHPLLLPHMASSTNSVPAALSDFGRMANLSNLMFLNPFNPPLAVIPPLFPTPGLRFRPNTLTLPQMPLQDVQKAGNSSRFPNDSSALPNSLLQSMGVLNAETLMELYRKELCSSYLMRSSQEATSRGGLFSGSMPGFQSGLSNSLTGNIAFPMPGKASSQDSAMNSEPLLLKKDKHDLSLDSNSEMCEICKKTFANKSLLLSHLATTHNIKQESCDLASELMKLDKLNEEHHFEKAMFGNMVAAKLVDRVQCDICNKEVCNKYFLKTHKIKVHGWDPVSGDRDMPEKPAAKQASPMQTQNIAPEPPMADMLNVEKPKEEELLQMGIDPEAYCEICKKEFCNKYFLKTHKQNIHGIKTTMNSLDNRTNPVETWNFPPVPSQPNSLTAAQLSLLASSQQLQSFAPALNAPPPLMSVLDSGLHDGSSSEKRSWKWKEPVNAMRVTCEICNKVLCNKYFLKTHMMKRHGVNYDTITGQLTSASAKSQLPSDYAPLVPRDESTHPQENIPMSMHHMAPQAEKPFPNNRTVARHTGIATEESQSMGEGGYGNEDDSSSAGGRITDRHDSSTRSSGNEGESRAATAVNLVVSEASKALDLTSAATTVMAKTWHVPSDDQDMDDQCQMNNDSHSSDATLVTSRFDGALPRGGAADDNDLLPGEGTEALKMHLMKDISLDEVHGSSEASSPLSSSFEENRNHQSTIQSAPTLGKFEGVPPETAKTAIANHIRSQQKKRLFRCTHCRERFQQRSQCEAHIRSAHPRSEGSGSISGHHADAGSERTSRKQSTSSSTNDPSTSTNPLGYLNGYASAKQPNFSGGGESAERKDVRSSDVLSKQPVIYAQPIDQTNLSNILMQPFLLKEVGGDNHFAASLVYLPALQKINEPVSVTFSLTPILQH